jgi:hypothetical protein
VESKKREGEVGKRRLMLGRLEMVWWFDPQECWEIKNVEECDDLGFSDKDDCEIENVDLGFLDGDDCEIANDADGIWKDLSKGIWKVEVLKRRRYLLLQR